jgi:hypothetical protein
LRVPQSGIRIDEGSFPLLQAEIVYMGTTSGNGNALGTTLVCADLDNHPTYAGSGNRVKILTNGAWGQDREIMTHAAGGILTVAQPFTDNTGAAQQILASTLFVILSSTGGGGGAGPVSPGIGLWMLGVCDPGMAGSTTTVVCPNLAGFPDYIFNDDFYMEVLRNTDNPGVAPEHEIQLITNYVGATGTFTTNAFSANVEADDFVAIIHHSLVGPQLNLISTLTRAIFDIVNASLVTTETGGTITTDGTEQDVYINNAPAGVFEPLKVQIDCTLMQAGDTIVLREKYRITPGGAFVKKDEVTLVGVQDPELKNIELEPNRFGVEVTIQRTAGGDRDYPWAVFYRG